MKLLTKLSIVALLTTTTNAAGGSVPYGYFFNGADWPFHKKTCTTNAGKEECTEWYCHLKNQSPIDLRTDMHSDPFPKADGTEFKGTYANIEKAKVQNKGLVVQVDFPDNTEETSLGKVSPANYFESGYAAEELGAPSKFNGLQFHFHAKSEHTINGQRYDMEMHTVHLQNGDKKKIEATDAYEPVDIFASAVGIIFDTKNYDPTVTAEERKIIDKFFDSLNFEATPPSRQEPSYWDTKRYFIEDTNIPYGDLLGVMNFANRWVYTGSLTTPPCNVGVLFNIFERVLPISQKHFDAYVAHQRSYYMKHFQTPEGTTTDQAGVSTDKYGKYIARQTLDATGNWRITNMVDNHNVKYMRAEMPVDESTDPKVTTTILGVLLGVSIFIAILLGICACKQMHAKSSGPQAAGEMAEEAEGGEDDQDKIEMQQIQDRN